MYQISSLEDYKKAYQQSIDNPEEFWSNIAENFTWRKKWDSVLVWNFDEPNINWFLNGKLNITENCLDRHLQTQPDKVALIWEPNKPTDETRIFTYRQVHEEVCRIANVLKQNGIQKGDRICIYLPMIPELAFAALACARIGAVHSIVFAGFSAVSLSDRINATGCYLVITADGLNRGNKQLNLKEIMDEALQSSPSVKRVLVIKATGMPINMRRRRDSWLHDELENVESTCQAEEMDAEDMLFILYTSGSTGKPKGVVHTTGGYMVYTDYTFRNVFQYQPDDIYWCTADIGWITGHSYLIYGPLLAGATSVMFEGVPNYPDAGRFWQVIDKHKVSVFYTAPTALRSLMQSGDEFVKPYKLDSLRVLGSVGEPINEEAWHWYHEKIGKKRCPIVDTWWQTETGGIMISTLAGVLPEKPGYAGFPMPGIQPLIVDNEGKPMKAGAEEGNLCIKFPWPGMLRTSYGDHERMRLSYFSTFPGMYFTGDGARQDAEGRFRIVGRVDDVINVSGHRFGTAEIENAIDEHQDVVESAVIGFPHPVKGQGIYAYVICHHLPENEDQLRQEINDVVSKQIGKIAKPDIIQVVSGLPKTRSGKIMRRILRKIAEGEIEAIGDTSTLLDPAIVDEIVAGAIRSTGDARR